MNIIWMEMQLALAEFKQFLVLMENMDLEAKII